LRPHVQGHSKSLTYIPIEGLYTRLSISD